MKKRLEEIKGQGIELELTGMPVLTPPEGVDIWDAKDTEMAILRQQAEQMVAGIKADQVRGVVKPYGWELQLLSTGGRRQIDVGAVIERYDRRIAMSVLADFILLGYEKVEGFALSSSKTEFFSVALGAWLGSIAEVFNQFAVPRLFALNPDFRGVGLPRLVPGDVESPPLDELCGFIRDMAGVGALTPGPELEDYLRQIANLPARDQQ